MRRPHNRPPLALAEQDGDTEARVAPRFIKLQEPLSEGQRVMARFQASSVRIEQLSSTRWFPARVLRIHDDGRCDVAYDDGDKEKLVRPQFVRALSDSQVLANIIHDAASASKGYWNRIIGIGSRHQADVPRWEYDADVVGADAVAHDGATASGGSGGGGACCACCGGARVHQRSLEVAHARRLAWALTAAAYGEEPSSEERINRERGYADDNL